MSRPYKCPHCSSSDTIWKGHRRRLDGQARLRKCNGCGRRFTTRVVIDAKNEARPPEANAQPTNAEQPHQNERSGGEAQ